MPVLLPADMRRHLIMDDTYLVTTYIPKVPTCRFYASSTFKRLNVIAFKIGGKFHCFYLVGHFSSPTFLPFLLPIVLSFMVHYVHYVSI